MRRAGLVVGETLELLRGTVRPGLTTSDLDAVAEKHIRAAGATPSFLGYHGYPATLCISVNDEVVHGIPRDRVLHAGDVVSIDCGAGVDGWHVASAITVLVGDADPEDVALVETTEEALWAGIAALAAGQRLGAVGQAV